MPEHHPTIERITLPTPYLIGPVHVYLVRNGDQRVLIDTGPPTDEAWDVLHAAVDPSRLDALLLTHCHPDHYGLAARLTDEYDIPVYLSRRDAAFFGREDEYLDVMLAQSVSFGVPLTERERAREALGSARRSTAPPTNYRLLEEVGEELTRFGIKALHCPGHSQGDHVFLVEHQAIGGDVIIPGALPVPLLDVLAEDFSQRFDNYRAWCSTIAQLGRLSDVTFLPAHGAVITDIPAEITSQVTRLLERATVLATMMRGRDDLYTLGHELYARHFELAFVQYIKLSGLVFMRDLLNAPNVLLAALDEAGLADPLRERFAALPQL